MSNVSNDVLTRVLGLGDDLAEQFGEVGQIFAQEFGFKDNRLSSVICKQLTSKKL